MVQHVKPGYCRQSKGLWECGRCPPSREAFMDVALSRRCSTLYDAHEGPLPISETHGPLYTSKKVKLNSGSNEDEVTLR
jgi:hypothetical protein